MFLRGQNPCFEILEWYYEKNNNIIELTILLNNSTTGFERMLENKMLGRESWNVLFWHQSSCQNVAKSISSYENNSTFTHNITFILLNSPIIIDKLKVILFQ